MYVVHVSYIVQISACIILYYCTRKTTAAALLEFELQVKYTRSNRSIERVNIGNVNSVGPRDCGVEAQQREHAAHLGVGRDLERLHRRRGPTRRHAHARHRSHVRLPPGPECIVLRSSTRASATCARFASLRPPPRSFSVCSCSLHLKEEAKEYLDISKLKEVIRKYSQFINFNIYLWTKKVCACACAPVLCTAIDAYSMLTARSVQYVYGDVHS